jgi:hypothetical protein
VADSPDRHSGGRDPTDRPPSSDGGTDDRGSSGDRSGPSGGGGSARAGAGGGGDRDSIGICCSGGGIRSAAFNLGALQALDEEGVLRRADYLSAVSGGAYIASAYAIANHRSDPELLAERPAFAPGTPEESWVRHHCSYLTDGFADTVRLLGVVLVGFVANLVFFTALLWTLARPLGWFYAWWQPGLRVPPECPAGQPAAAATASGCEDQVVLTGLTGWATAAAVLAGLGLAVCLFVRMFMPRWSARLYLRRLGVALMGGGALVALVALAVPALLLFTRNVLGGEPPTGPVEAAAGDGSPSDTGTAALGVIAGVGGTATIVALLVQVARSVHTVARVGVRAASSVTTWTGGLSRGLRRITNLVLGTLIGPLALAAVAVLILNGGAQSATPTGGEVALWALFSALTLVLLGFADVTSWSLHPFYKWRLSNTFAVRRVVDPVDPADTVAPGADTSQTGSPGAGTERGAVTGAGICRGRASLIDYGELLTLSSFAPGSPPPFPELLVCAAINVSDPGITPPGRSCLSFVFSPTSVGHHGLGLVRNERSWLRRVAQPSDTTATGTVRPLAEPAATAMTTGAVQPLHMATRDYEEAMSNRRRRAITLSAAVALSGAAVAPSMGKMTRAPLRFLLALTNVRLGVWLPNPANMPRGLSVRGRTLVPANPRQIRLLHEVLGRHRIGSKFLYVTDGGHIENLGLLELLRRRCRTIVCLDAAGGSTTTFSTLGEAISLAASELNVAVDIDPTVMATFADGVHPCAHVTGTIRYPDGTTGTLVYGKALVTATASWGVRAYAAKDPQFPVHPTVDQLYSGETFDAYQALGRCVGHACAAEVPAGGTASATEPAPPPSARRATAAPRRRARPGWAPTGVTDIRVRDVATAATELS